MVPPGSSADAGAGVNITALELELTDAEIEAARAVYEATMEDGADCDPDVWAEHAERTYARILRRTLAERAAS